MDAEIERLRNVFPEIVELLESRFAYSTAEAVVSEGLQIRVDNREQQAGQSSKDAGVVLTVLNGTVLEEFGTSELAPESVMRQAREWLAGLAPDSARRAIDAARPQVADYATTAKIPPASIPLRDKFARVVERQARAREMDSRIVNATVGYTESRHQILFASRGRLLSQELLRSRASTSILVGEGGRVQYDTQIVGGSMGMEVWDELEKERPLEELCSTALRLLEAGPIPGGMYDCLAAPEVTGTVAHESFGHGVETDMFLKGRARAAGYLGQRIAPPAVNILDDPTLPGAFGTYFFDDQGEMARPTFIVRDGNFERGISDLYSALELGIPRTGNGRRESFARKVYARMSNTFFGRGSTPAAEMIAGMDDGIYLTRLQSGMEDPKGWGIQLLMHYAKEIKHGRFTGKLFTPVAMTGYVPEVLASISQVGDDFWVDTGYCGKGNKEYIEVSAGGPHLRLRARLS